MVASVLSDFYRHFMGIGYRQGRVESQVYLAVQTVTEPPRANRLDAFHTLCGSMAQLGNDIRLHAVQHPRQYRLCRLPNDA